MSTELIPYIKWGDYKSSDQNNPDILEIKVCDLNTSDSEYSVNVQILLKVGDKLECKYLPLKSHKSKNASLLKQWDKGIRSKKIKKGKQIRLKTWLGETQFDFPIRRYVLEF